MMEDPAPGELTLLLKQWSAGNAGALERLVELAYPRLREIAGRRMAGERHGHTLQATALVNEAVMKLMELDRMEWKNRDQLFALATTVMRRLLVDHARARKGPKRGGGAIHVTLHDQDMVGAGPDLDVLALDAALERLQASHARPARVVELRCFGGLSADDIGELLGVNKRTVERDFRFATAWLRRALSEQVT